MSTIKITTTQKEVIKNATKENDFCVLAHKRTMNSLVEKGLARYSSGFGFRYGAFIELTEKGKEVQKTIL